MGSLGVCAGRQQMWVVETGKTDGKLEGLPAIEECLEPVEPHVCLL